ncbi:MAG: hypothetical protein IPM63_03565 [Acidobacteriota bacterium]|nr:MAG: hypothetical protein IPM63_03565 [Acidobacteriota bacterium]
MKKLCLILTVALQALNGAAYTQTNGENEARAVMWKKVDIASRDLYLGPGGDEMVPDISRVEFVEEKKGGSSLKYEIIDANGREWVAKIDKESQPETAAVRLLWGLGYLTEINYLVPEITIPGKGTFKNVRLEARPKDIDRGDRWEWDENPFVGTKELAGLKIMMVFFNNWDVKTGNNIILNKDGTAHYAISDLGATFGQLGGNDLPIIWRFGRSINEPEDYEKTELVEETDGNKIELAYKGRKSGIFDEATKGEARWLVGLLRQLSKQQIRDAFRAANYTDDEIETYVGAVIARIDELDKASR